MNENDAAICQQTEEDVPSHLCCYISPGSPENEAYRLTTFRDYPLNIPACLFSQFGFFYTGYKKRIKCFSCGHVIEDWNANDPCTYSWHEEDCSFVCENDNSKIAIQLNNLVLFGLSEVLNNSNDPQESQSSAFNPSTSTPKANASGSFFLSSSNECPYASPIPLPLCGKKRKLDRASEEQFSNKCSKIFVQYEISQNPFELFRSTDSGIDINKTSIYIADAKTMGFSEQSITSVIRRRYDEQNSMFDSMLDLVEALQIDEKKSEEISEEAGGQITEQDTEVDEVLLCRVCRKIKVCLLFYPCRHCICCVKCGKCLDYCPSCGEYIKSRHEHLLRLMH